MAPGAGLVTGPSRSLTVTAVAGILSRSGVTGFRTQLKFAGRAATAAAPYVMFLSLSDLCSRLSLSVKAGPQARAQ